jgi:hypothetical protein
MPRAGMGRAFGANRTGCGFEIGSGKATDHRPQEVPQSAREGACWCARGRTRSPRPALPRHRVVFPIRPRVRGKAPPNHDPVNKPGLQPCHVSCGQTPGRCPGLGWAAPLALTGRGAVLKLAQGKPPTTGRRRSHNQPARARAGAPEGGRAPRDRRCRAIAWCALFARESGAKPRPHPSLGQRPRSPIEHSAQG